MITKITENDLRVWDMKMNNYELQRPSKTAFTTNTIDFEII